LSKNVVNGFFLLRTAIGQFENILFNLKTLTEDLLKRIKGIVPGKEE